MLEKSSQNPGEQEVLEDVDDEPLAELVDGPEELALLLDGNEPLVGLEDGEDTTVPDPFTVLAQPVTTLARSASTAVG